MPCACPLCGLQDEVCAPEPSNSCAGRAGTARGGVARTSADPARGMSCDGDLHEGKERPNPVKLDGRRAKKRDGEEASRLAAACWLRPCGCEPVRRGRTTLSCGRCGRA